MSVNAKQQLWAIANRLSLRQPQRDSLEILDKVCELLHLSKETDAAQALQAVQSAFPSVTDFERDFASLCFALATGVGNGCGCRKHHGWFATYRAVVLSAVDSGAEVLGCVDYDSLLSLGAEAAVHLNATVHRLSKLVEHRDRRSPLLHCPSFSELPFVLLGSRACVRSRLHPFLNEHF